MVTGAEGITGLVLVSAMGLMFNHQLREAYSHNAGALANHKHSKLPAVSSSPPNRIATMVSRHSGESCQTLAISFAWLSALNDCANSHASNLPEVLHQGEKASQLLQRLTRMRYTGVKIWCTIQDSNLKPRG